MASGAAVLAMRSGVAVLASPARVGANAGELPCLPVHRGLRLARQYWPLFGLSESDRLQLSGRRTSRRKGRGGSASLAQRHVGSIEGSNAQADTTVRCAEN